MTCRRRSSCTQQDIEILGILRVASIPRREWVPVSGLWIRLCFPFVSSPGGSQEERLCLICIDRCLMRARASNAQGFGVNVQRLWVVGAKGSFCDVLHAREGRVHTFQLPPPRGCQFLLFSTLNCHRTRHPRASSLTTPSLLPSPSLLFVPLVFQICRRGTYIYIYR
jgi:hypothetical protein